MQVKILSIFASLKTVVVAQLVEVPYMRDDSEGTKLKTVVVAQLVRASDCDSEGRGFEPPRLPKAPHHLRGFSLLSLKYCIALVHASRNIPSWLSFRAKLHLSNSNYSVKILQNLHFFR